MNERGNGLVVLMGVLLFVAFVLILANLVVEEGRYKKRLMEQCLADGKKEYECRALINSGDTQVQMMPVFIPVGH